MGEKWLKSSPKSRIHCGRGKGEPPADRLLCTRVKPTHVLRGEGLVAIGRVAHPTPERSVVAALERLVDLRHNPSTRGTPKI